ncbi:Rieske 2Fe-2S domain-containing protein [Streptomyces mirabilis]|uniref:Rieske 2Fe-2S domain-containing protein n=1 Tax=Streptomyces mirabilis TaxID=68239 RepID=UPI00332B7E47
MRITSLGHAGLLLETAAGRIVCDPWFNPAFYDSWIPFPDNSGIDPRQFADAEYLYVSHLHRDHFDAKFLREHMSKDTAVLLPDYPVPELRDELESLGFRNFIQTRNNEVVELDGGLRVLTNALTKPTKSPVGDSGLVVDDGRVRIYNQNDSRPVETVPISQLGPLHGHFVQFTGANWYPMVYDFADEEMADIGRRKRANGMTRAVSYIEHYGAAHIFPFAGPTCFLDDALFDLNDLADDDTNVFPDQFTFLRFMQERGYDHGHLFLPGTVVTLAPDGTAEVEQVPETEIARIRDDRRGYLLDYKRKVQPLIDAGKTALPTDRSDLLGQLQEWLEPLLAIADSICAKVNGRVLLEVVDGDDCEQIVFDFLDRRVARYAGEEWRDRFRVARPLVEDLVRRRVEDWANELFLSCRFEASRRDGYNEFVYTFFQCLSVERLTLVESCFEDSTDIKDFARAGDHVIQRKCPHMDADLVAFGTVDDGVLTCQMHGWEFDLATGKCLVGDDRRLVSRPLRTDAEGAAADAAFPSVDDGRGLSG